MSSVFIEDITEEMGGNPETENWTSVIDGMTIYRVWQDENNAIVYKADMDNNKDAIVDDETHEYILDLVDEHNGR